MSTASLDVVTRLRCIFILRPRTATIFIKEVEEELGTRAFRVPDVEEAAVWLGVPGDDSFASSQFYRAFMATPLAGYLSRPENV